MGKSLTTLRRLTGIVLRRGIPSALLLAGMVFGAAVARAQYGGVTTTVHNLSASGPGEVKALDETEVCKFCHIPHNSVAPVPLWSHSLPATGYEVRAPLSRQRMQTAAGQPDGSSRLCLSCHDGTVALGKISGEPQRIAMAGAQRLGPGRRGFIGTDLSGSHPISFVVPSGEEDVLDSDRDMGLRSLAAIESSPVVRLDNNGKMQCTTCHDPHSNRYYQSGLVPRFWVAPTVDEVCLTCHELR